MTIIAMFTTLNFLGTFLNKTIKCPSTIIKEWLIEKKSNHSGANGGVEFKIESCMGITY